MANHLNKELKGRYVLIQAQILKPIYHKPFLRVFFCQDGFGCSPVTSGTAVFGKFISDGEECRMEGYNIERFATKREIERAKEFFETATVFKKSNKEQGVQNEN